MAVATSRTAKADIELCGYHVPAGVKFFMYSLKVRDLLRMEYIKLCESTYMYCSSVGEYVNCRVNRSSHRFLLMFQ